MGNQRFCFLLAVLALVAIVILQAPLANRLGSPGPKENMVGNAKGIVAKAYGQLPLSFEMNKGQADESVKFLARGAGYKIFLMENEAVLTMRHPRTPEANTRPSGEGLRMKLVGATPSSDVAGETELVGKSNYFIGKDPNKWHTNVPNYSRVRYADVYPGIDLVYYGKQGNLEYDFIVSPGGDPSSIRITFEGADALTLDSSGNLILQTPQGGDLIQHAPFIYQKVNGTKKTVSGGYVLQSKNVIAFRTGEYDVHHPLIIDPVLEYSTYLGGGSFDQGFGIAVDSAGNGYITGSTRSADFPTMAGSLASTLGGGDARVCSAGFFCEDAFVTKIDATGSALVYSTYLGGLSTEAGLSISVDSSGSAYIMGYTDSADFPTRNPVQPALGGGQDAFITKLGPAGDNLIYSTYLGGSNSDVSFNGIEGAIAVDELGSAYITGFTISSDFPVTAGAIQSELVTTFGPIGDAFVSKLEPTGRTLVYSTYLGGAHLDVGSGISVDSEGNAYIVGFTDSSDFPVTASAFQTILGGRQRDAFIAKVNATGSALVYSSLLGGSGLEQGLAITVDSSGNAYVTGNTTSSDFPVTNGAFQTDMKSGVHYDAFVAKLDASGSTLVFATYLGGSGIGEVASGNSIAIDPFGNAYIAGATLARNFPTMYPLQSSNGGDVDAFVVKLNHTGSDLLFSTYFGGKDKDADQGGSNTAKRTPQITVDSSGNVYITGYTSSTDFPIENALQPNIGGFIREGFFMDAFVTKMCGATPDEFSLSFADQFVGTTSPEQTIELINHGSVPLTVTGIATSGDFVQADTCAAPIEVGASCNISVAFRPSEIGTRFGQVTITDDVCGNSYTAKFSGTGVIPKINSGGTVNGASFSAGGSLAPGSIISVFGTNLSSSTLVAESVPLPTTLGGVTLQINGNPLPLLFVSPRQINFLLPNDLLVPSEATLRVIVTGLTSNEEPISLSSFGPGLFVINQNQGAILTETGEVAAPSRSIVGRTSRPARRGEFISIFGTGLGEVTNPPAIGAAAAGSPLSETTTAPSVTIGGVLATVSFSGLAPGFVGLYQVNVEVPPDAPTGNAVPVVLTIGGSTSNTVTIAVR